MFRFIVISIQQWTMEEVNQHNNKDDCWLVMNNRIYDVSPFIPVHPGGDSIFKNAGKDNTVGS
jgi:cytochrome b involved in lipid metabolism